MNILRSIDTNKIIKCDYVTFPHDQSVTYKKRLKIGVKFKNFEDTFGITETRLYFDGEMVSHRWTDTMEIVYDINNELSIGTHDARLEVLDGREGEFHIKWRFLIQSREESLKIYYGNPHSHTSYSDGKMTPTDAYEYAKDKGIHFMAVSDHVGKLLKSQISCDDNICLCGEGCAKWEMTKIEAERFNNLQQGFVALAGYELSTRFWGHVNIIDCDEIVDKKKFVVEDMIHWLHYHEDILISVNHPFKTVGMLPCCSPFNKCVMLYEYGNGSPPREYKRAEERYFEALDEGWYLGAVNGQDNHLKNWGDGENLTGVLCTALNREEIVKAMKMRRVFSTESRTLRLNFRIDGYWMGSIINAEEGESLRVDLYVEDRINSIDRVQLITNKGDIAQEYLLNGSKIIKSTVDIEASREHSWYLIKVVLEDGRVGISSPVFLKYAK